MNYDNSSSHYLYVLSLKNLKNWVADLYLTYVFGTTKVRNLNEI